MKKDDKVQVRRFETDEWVECTLDITSANRLSIAVSAEEGLFPPDSGIAFNIDTGRQQLLLMKVDAEQPHYLELYTEALWEVRGFDQ